ncbi:acyl-coenzyme A diphosphatase NUDT19-like [Lycorma delicatula]|uniref:acyl-coenzyme A diphosphatase NUDT19-like n=1 Tax=Lycorma delicatula TaxID=130591 RepID=UPI003F516249
MKKWKEAASVILAAPNSSSFLNAGVLNGLSKDYKLSSKAKPDFKILALKKSGDSPLLPGRYVFPGGMVNTADSADEWISLFRKFGFSIEKLCKSINNDNTNLPIFEGNVGGRLPRCISLRITAIRETFEESGILLCKTKLFSPSILFPVTANHLKINDICSWRDKVLKNPREFINLCRDNDCYPDVASLYLWSDWLTPSHIPLRFDSVFFFSFLRNMFEGTEDNYEIESLKWATADSLLQEFHSGVLKLHFPQFYEISCIARFTSLSTLSQFAVKHNGMESEVWMPVRIFAQDGEISLLPGDEMYPKRVNYETSYVIIGENTKMASYKRNQMHRMVIENNNPDLIKLVITNMDNVPSKHILPLCPGSVKGKL